MGLLFPPFIKRLDFKSKEELQQMPQTEEEHLENQNLDYEDQEKQHPDAEVSAVSKLLYMCVFFATLFTRSHIVCCGKSGSFSLVCFYFAIINLPKIKYI